MGKIFYISDTHFGHANIIRFDERPFSSVEQMEETIVNNWNNVVTNQDDVYILGDFCWSKDENEWLRLLNRLNGRKFLIKGNHDLKQYSQKLKNALHDIKEYKEIKDGDRSIIMCHYPILFYRSSYDDKKWMFCGHTHNRTEEELARQKIVRQFVDEKQMNKGHIINVGCMMDYMRYTPRTADELIAWWHENYGV